MIAQVLALFKSLGMMNDRRHSLQNIVVLKVNPSFYAVRCIYLLAPGLIMRTYKSLSQNLHLSAAISNLYPPLRRLSIFRYAKLGQARVRPR